MKRIFIIFLALFLTGCDYYYEEGISNIKEPEKLNYEMDGRWSLVDVKDMKGESLDKQNYADKAFFHKNMVYLEDIYGENIEYSIKSVDATDYLVYKYKISPENLDIRDKRINIFNLNVERRHLTELIKIDEGKFSYFKDGRFLIYEREDADIDREELQDYLRANISMESNIHKLESRGNIGFIIGIKELQDNGSYTYRTEYIQIINDTKIIEYKAADILLPRKNGFYSISIENQGRRDNIRIKYLDKETEDIFIETDLIKNILYIGNDFMSVENIDNSGKGFLRLYPIDYLEENRISRLSDILDESTYEKVKKDIKHNQPERVLNNYDDANFGIRRNKGYWTLFGRVNHTNKAINTYEDFRIRAVTPKSIVNYDELPILWNVIESEIPNVEDAFISPKNDYLIARLRSEIKIFPILDGKIGKNEIYSLDIGENEEIIMNEWATNIYSEIWSGYFRGDGIEKDNDK